MAALWRAYLATLGERPETTAKTFDHWPFGDNAADANALAALVRRGVKRATSPSVWELEERGLPLPQPGDLHVVTDWEGVAQCVIRTTAVEVVPFGEVSAAHAAREGEGDGSLGYWRHVHRAYYRRVLAGTERTPSEDMPVVCEAFEVVFQKGQAAGGAP